MPTTSDPAARLTDEPAPKARTEFERDRDRVLYSSAFARLAGITQVATTAPGHGFHNRLTHTLKVGQLSARAAKLLRAKYAHNEEAMELDADAAEAAAFAHDLGHPPFGHVGEAALNRLADAAGCGGFDANAQSFRVINRIARRSVQFQGLNLTRLALNGMLKYPWLRSTTQSNNLAYTKWGAYDAELREFNHARDRAPNASAIRSDVQSKPSLTAHIIDWADDVTYAIHDLEDFYKAGLIPVEDIVWRPDASKAFLASFFDEGDLRPKFRRFTAQEIETAVDSLRALFATSLNRPYDGSIELRALVRYVSSYLIGEYFNALELRIEPGEPAPGLRMDIALEAEVAVLKELLWFYVIDRPEFAAMQNGQRRVLQELFGVLSEAAENKSEWRLFPSPVRASLRDGPADSGSEQAIAMRARIILDYLSGMTELAVAELYEAVSGNDMHSVLGR